MLVVNSIIIHIMYLPYYIFFFNIIKGGGVGDFDAHRLYSSRIAKDLLFGLLFCLPFAYDTSGLDIQKAHIFRSERPVLDSRKQKRQTYQSTIHPSSLKRPHARSSSSSPPQTKNHIIYSFSHHHVHQSPIGPTYIMLSIHMLCA